MKLVAILLIFLTACGSSVTKNEPRVEEITNQESDLIDIPFKVLFNDSNSSFENMAFEVFEDSKEMETALIMVNKTRKPGLVAPEIDFSNHRVVLLCMGGRSSGGFGITVDRVEKTATNIIVYYTQKNPQPGQPVTMALTSPWIMVQFKHHNLPVIFAPINN